MHAGGPASGVQRSTFELEQAIPRYIEHGDKELENMKNRIPNLDISI